MTDDAATRHLLYFADPMCSWCWGFSPAVQRLRSELAETLPLRLIMGGLQPGNTETMTPRAKEEVRDHWEHVRDASGQPFDFAFFERDGFVYDTEPACRAVVTVRRLDGAKALAMLDATHHAFYAENRDVTDKAELTAIAETLGVDAAAFSNAFEDVETVTETQGDFWLSQASGVTGFPTLLAVENGKAQIVTIGYRPWDAFGDALHAWAATPIPAPDSPAPPGPV